MQFVHDVEHMERELPAGPMGAVFPDRPDHVGQTDPPTVLPVRTLLRNFPPVSVVLSAEADDAVEPIGIGHHQGSLLPVNLDVGQGGAPHVEAGDDRAHRPAGKIEHPRHVGGNVNGKSPRLVSRADHLPLGKGDGSRPRDPADGTQENTRAVR